MNARRRGKLGKWEASDNGIVVILRWSTACRSTKDGVKTAVHIVTVTCWSKYTYNIQLPTRGTTRREDTLGNSPAHSEQGACRVRNHSHGPEGAIQLLNQRLSDRLVLRQPNTIADEEVVQAANILVQLGVLGAQLTSLLPELDLHLVPLDVERLVAADLERVRPHHRVELWLHALEHLWRLGLGPPARLNDALGVGRELGNHGLEEEGAALCFGPVGVVSGEEARVAWLRVAVGSRTGKVGAVCGGARAQNRGVFL